MAKSTGLQEENDVSMQDAALFRVLRKRYLKARIVLYGMTRIHNPITSRALSIKYVGIGTEVFQIAFIIIAAIILPRETRRRAPQVSQKEVTR